MKKTIATTCLVLLGVVAQAQMYVFKTTPKTFTDEIGVQRTVIGIHAGMVSNIPIKLSTKRERVFYIAFQLSDSTFYGGRNASTEDFIVRAGGSQSARTNVMNLIKNLEFGTISEIYAAAQQLAAIYGYTLLPLSQQEQEP